MELSVQQSKLLLKDYNVQLVKELPLFNPHLRFTYQMLLDLPLPKDWYTFTRIYGVNQTHGVENHHQEKETLFIFHQVRIFFLTLALLS